MDDARKRLRHTFDEVPAVYERSRPRYPPELFDDLIALTGVRQDARLLEIGPGTGQATLPLAERGYEIVGIELGAGLADHARRTLERFPKVTIVDADFETWSPVGERFDAVVAFTAWQWIDPELRYRKSADVLKPAGALAVVATKHVLPVDGDPFWIDVQKDYEAVVPDEEATKAGAPGPPESVSDLGDEIEASGMFSNVAVRRYVWEVSYSTEEYITVLHTHSGHRDREPVKRRRLDDLIRKRIDARPERSVTKTYLATLNVARSVTSE